MFHDWPAGVDWSDHQFPASLNVADIACGTGTLLMAVAAERRHTFALSPAGMGVSTRTVRDAGRVYGGGSRGAAQEELATLPDLDLAIMNPPFTRSVGGNLLFGSLPAADRR